jgi:hypothetical protein
VINWFSPHHYLHHWQHQLPSSFYPEKEYVEDFYDVIMPIFPMPSERVAAKEHGF